MTSCVDFLNNYADMLSNNPNQSVPRPHPVLFTGTNCTGSFWPPLNTEAAASTALLNPYGTAFQSLYIPPGWKVTLRRPNNDIIQLPGPSSDPNAPILYTELSSVVGFTNSLHSIEWIPPFTTQEFIRLSCAENKISVTGLRTLTSFRPGSPECDSFMTSFCNSQPSHAACVCLAEELALQTTFCTADSKLAACSNVNQLAAFLPVTCFGHKCSSSGYRFERMRNQRCNITLCRQTLTALGESVVIDGSSTLWCGNRPFSLKPNEPPTTPPSVSIPPADGFSLPSWAMIVIGFAVFIVFVVTPLFVIMVRRAYARTSTNNNEPSFT
jgi:hypothetical protein